MFQQCCCRRRRETEQDALDFGRLFVILGRVRIRAVRKCRRNQEDVSSRGLGRILLFIGENLSMETVGTMDGQNADMVICMNTRARRVQNRL